MDKYHVKLLSQALQQLDEIYEYITNELKAQIDAENLIDKLEEAIFSLEIMPYRFPKRRAGVFANKNYRQIFVKNFCIVYRVDEVKKEVIVVAVRYSRSNF